MTRTPARTYTRKALLRGKKYAAQQEEAYVQTEKGLMVNAKLDAGTVC